MLTNLCSVLLWVVIGGAIIDFVAKITRQNIMVKANVHELSYCYSNYSLCVSYRQRELIPVTLRPALVELLVT